MELHPRIRSTNLQLLETKIILGSFPTWTLTAPDYAKGETLKEKEYQRKKNMDIPYFYGSSGNKFWLWYEKFIDASVSKTDIKGIQNSLKKNKIGITDMIFQCTRKNRSSFDNDLSDRVYNYMFFKYPKENEKIKILCTSKGVMNEMFLNKAFFTKYDDFKISTAKSAKYQKKIIFKIAGDLSKIKKPCYIYLENTLGGTIECIAIPSPGSPYRGLNAFGLNSSNSNKYLEDYLREAFAWFKS